jgi:hypothetical protein
MPVIISYITVTSLSIIALALYIRQMRIQRVNRAIEEALRVSETPIGDRLAREMGLDI